MAVWVGGSTVQAMPEVAGSGLLPKESLVPEVLGHGLIAEFQDFSQYTPTCDDSNCGPTTGTDDAGTR